MVDDTPPRHRPVRVKRNNIADRVSAAGGVLAIDTAEGHGTRVSAVLPS